MTDYDAIQRFRRDDEGMTPKRPASRTIQKAFGRRPLRIGDILLVRGDGPGNLSLRKERFRIEGETENFYICSPYPKTEFNRFRECFLKVDYQFNLGVTKGEE